MTLSAINMRSAAGRAPKWTSSERKVSKDTNKSLPIIQTNGSMVPTNQHVSMTPLGVVKRIVHASLFHHCHFGGLHAFHHVALHAATTINTACRPPQFHRLIDIQLALINSPNNNIAGNSFTTSTAPIHSQHLNFRLFLFQFFKPWHATPTPPSTSTKTTIIHAAAMNATMTRKSRNECPRLSDCVF